MILLRPAIRSARTAELDDDARAAVVKLCIASHANPNFERFFTFMRPENMHALAFVGGELVGHAVISTRAAQPEGHQVLKTAYIDAVSTSPDHQHRGIGSAVMREIERLAIEDRYEIGGLETDLRGFYEPLGWELWRGPLAGRERDGTLVPTPHQTGVMVLRLPRTPDIDVDSLLTIECQPDRIW